MSSASNIDLYVEIMTEETRLDVVEGVLLEVLSRLPSKTLARFKPASRRWEKLLSDPYMLAAHVHRSAQRRRNSLLPLDTSLVKFSHKICDILYIIRKNFYEMHQS